MSSPSRTAPYQAEYIPEIVETARAHGWPAEALTADQAQAEVALPDLPRRGLPARGAWPGRPGPPGRGVWRRGARGAGADLRALAGDGAWSGDGGACAPRRRRRVRARRVMLATSAFPPLVRAIRRYVVPVYDYVLVTEPLSAEQRDSLGWAAPAGPDRHRQPVPLLPADQRRPHPVRRLRRRLQLPQRQSAPTSTSGPRRSSCSPLTSSRPSRSSRACASPTAGAARSTPARASR